MARGKRYKSKSDYTLLRNKHQSISNGDIFEHDHMTISKFDEYFSEQVPVYSDYNFKFSVRPGSHETRRHTRLGWQCPDNTSDDSCVWTLENIPELSSQVESSPKPVIDYTKLNSFAYYGSAVDLVNATINGIVRDFPAELYFSNKEMFVVTGIDENGVEIEEKYYIISNPYEIDIHSKSASASEVLNSMRYFCLSADKYEIIKSNGEIEKLVDFEEPWYSEVKEVSCEGKKKDYGEEQAIVKLADGSITIYVRNINGTLKFLYKDESLIGTHVRPLDDIVETYFLSLDDFTNVILNRKTNPVYRSRFETTTFSDKNGYTTKLITYIWPSIGGFNPDITNESGFKMFLDDMIELATYHDEYTSDNIWRIMTHEAIKNLDWTFSSDKRNPIDELNPLDSTRIESMCKLYGRQYDDLKIYIDSIKYTNNITYNRRNNAPDYCLSDLLAENGWNVRSLNFFCDNTVRTESLYPSESFGYNQSETTINFFNRLLLNTRYIYSLKGTRIGIDTIMSMFGYDKDEYEVNEFVGVALPRDLSYLTIKTALKISGLDSFISSEFERYKSGDLNDDKNNKFYCWRKVKHGDVYYVYTQSEYEGLDVENVKYYFKNGESQNETELVFCGYCDMSYDKDLITDTSDFKCLYPKYDIVKKYNQKKDNYDIMHNGNEYDSVLCGIYSNYVYVEDEDGNDLSYVIPWCDKTQHDGNVNFQGLGGWMNESKRLVNLEQFEDIKQLVSVPGDGFGLYNETKVNVIFISTLSDLLEYPQDNLKTGDICYVTDITNIKTSYVSKNDEEKDLILNNHSTHYFILKNVSLSYTLGFYNSSDESVLKSQYGWKNIKDYEVSQNTLTNDGKKVVYFESIIKDNEGNNPHIGNGMYDEGDEYFNETETIFNWSLFNDNLSTFSEHEYGQAARLGFNIEKSVDNRKVWHFYNDENENRVVEIIGDLTASTGNVNIGRNADRNYSLDYKGKSYYSDLYTFNPETQETKNNIFIDNTEPACNSIVNLKNVELVFKPKCFVDESIKFFKESVMPYLTMLIPSTSIINVRYESQSYGKSTTDKDISTIENITCPRITINEETIDGTIGCSC